MPYGERQLIPNRTIGTKTKKQRKAGQLDFTVLFIVVLLTLFGLVMIFSSSYYYALTNSNISSMYFFFRRQLMWAGLGLGSMIILANMNLFFGMNYQILKKLSFPIYCMANVFLVLVLIIGSETKGAQRWFDIAGLSVQPSEIAKIAVILFLAAYISNHKNEVNTGKGFLKCAAIIMIPVILIAAENLSTAVVVLCIGVVILFLVSSKTKYFFYALVPTGVLGAIAIMLPQFAYRFDRIKIWLDPFSDPTGDGFQTIQSLYAVASGGIFGLGLGQSRQKTFVPEPYNDIIFAIICEELGLVGAIIVIILFTLLVWRGLKIAINSPDMFACLAAAGITAMIGIQVFINIAVTTNLIPNTGMSLPFISYGGSSLFLMLSSVGLLLNISKYRKFTE